eukprot:GHVR01072657.1.p1 GENE.GHVR01072657.1~~GHVR01072657.1.p1  ORF type:complete len:168 (-),score=23.75 GHVR01072657.1:1632-2135(-)
MEDQIKELIAREIKLDYREIYEDTAVILRWGDDVHYIKQKISYHARYQDPKQIFKDREVTIILTPPTRKEIDEIKDATERLIKSSIENGITNHQKKVDDNFKAFNKILPTILDANRNQYALMKDCEIIEYFSTFKDADKAGMLLYKDHMFSVQKVTDEVINLGTFSL